jgi:hypothetical protein
MFFLDNGFQVTSSDVANSSFQNFLFFLTKATSVLLSLLLFHSSLERKKEKRKDKV